MTVSRPSHVAINYHGLNHNNQSFQYTKKWRILLALGIGISLIGLCVLVFYLTAESKRPKEEAGLTQKEKLATLSSDASMKEWRTTVDIEQCFFSTQQMCSKDFGESPVFLLLLGGLRIDQVPEIPALLEFEKCGASASTLVPSYPTFNYPNLYSIATGLFPESHGIISWKMHDDNLQKNFTAGDPSSLDPDWWMGEPIWNTLEKNEKKTATFLWPGSNVRIQGSQPTFYQNDKVDFDIRMKKVVDWILLPKKERPQLIMMYYEDLVLTAQKFGPFSPETKEQFAIINNGLDELMSSLHKSNIFNCVNIIVASDHGITSHGVAASSCESTIYIDEMVEEPIPGRLFTGTVGRIDFYENADETTINRIIKKLQCKDPALRALKKNQVPKRYHYTKGSRIGDIVLDTKPGSRIATDTDGKCLAGLFGYNDLSLAMQGVFVAQGPSFKVGYRTDSFRNIEIYNLLARMLNVEPAPNNGTMGSLLHLLKLNLISKTDFKEPQKSYLQESIKPVPVRTSKAVLEKPGENEELPNCPCEQMVPDQTPKGKSTSSTNSSTSSTTTTSTAKPTTTSATTTTTTTIPTTITTLTTEPTATTTTTSEPTTTAASTTESTTSTSTTEPTTSTTESTTFTTELTSTTTKPTTTTTTTTTTEPTTTTTTTTAEPTTAMVSATTTESTTPTTEPTTTTTTTEPTTTTTTEPTATTTESTTTTTTTESTTTTTPTEPTTTTTTTEPTTISSKTTTATTEPTTTTESTTSSIHAEPIAFVDPIEEATTTSTTTAEPITSSTITESTKTSAVITEPTKNSTTESITVVAAKLTATLAPTIAESNTSLTSTTTSTSTESITTITTMEMPAEKLDTTAKLSEISATFVELSATPDPTKKTTDTTTTSSTSTIPTNDDLASRDSKQYSLSETPEDIIFANSFEHTSESEPLTSDAVSNITASSSTTTTANTSTTTTESSSTTTNTITTASTNTTTTESASTTTTSTTTEADGIIPQEIEPLPESLKVMSLVKEVSENDMKSSNGSTLQSLHCPWGFPSLSAPEVDSDTLHILLHSSHIIGFPESLDLGVWTSFTITKKRFTELEKHLPRGPDDVYISPQERKKKNLAIGCWISDSRLQSSSSDQCSNIFQTDMYKAKNVSLRQLFPEEFEDDETLNWEGFLLSNLAPLMKGFERGPRRIMLEEIEKWTKQKGSLNVVHGPVFDYNYDGKRDSITHLRNTIKPLIPSNYFYVVTLCNETKDSDDSESDYTDTSLLSCPLVNMRVYSFIFPNIENEDTCHLSNEHYLKYHSASVADVEALTSLRFFKSMNYKDYLQLRARQPIRIP